MEIWKRNARDIARLFASGEASAVDITKAHLARIDEVNPGLNAIVRRIDDQALEAAKAVDAAKADGAPLGPLAGVPFTIKANIDLAGSPTDNGVPVFEGAIPEQDAPVVERMKAAGAIPLARTNMPDLGLRMHTDSLLYGATLNPWNKAHTTGGSSGGEAVALATGMSPIGLGNDLGGSLRNPATCCSIASIKPSFGRVPRCAMSTTLPDPVTFQLMSTEGPMARTVGDVRLGLEVLSGRHPLDGWSVPIPLEAKPGQKRVAIMADPPGGETDPRIAEITRKAGAALEAAGVSVEEIDIPAYEDVINCWVDHVVGSVSLSFDMLRPIISESAADFIQNSVKYFGPFTPERLIPAWDTRHKLLGKWNAFFETYDAILTPGWAQLPLLAGEDAKGEAGARKLFETCRPVLAGNLLGLPSAAVPAGIVDGLPVGVLITGAQWSDLTCLELTEAIESAGLAPQTPIL